MDARVLEIEGWMAPQELDWLYMIGQRLPEGSIGVELGSWFGRSSAALFLGAGLGKTIVSVDHWAGTPTEPAHDIAKAIDVCSVYLNNIACLGITVTPYKKGVIGPQYISMDSLEASELFDDGSLSFLLVDDDHRRPGLALDCWLSKMAPDSIVSGHDYFCFYEYIQPQVHDRLSHINEIHHSIWVRYWRTKPEDSMPRWYSTEP